MKREHAIKKRAYMSQPASGHYVDCRCGRTGGLKPTAQEAQEDYDAHLARVASGEPEPKRPWE